VKPCGVGAVAETKGVATHEVEVEVVTTISGCLALTAEVQSTVKLLRHLHMRNKKKEAQKEEI